MKRIIEFSANNQVEIILAYYLPCHSKYNSVERVWGVLEKHCNGDILDSTETMTWKGKNPVVCLIEKVYETGKTVKKETMEIYELMIDRSKQTGKWSVTIKSEKCKEVSNMEIKI